MKKIAAVVVATLASGSVFAADTATVVTDAISDGTSNVQLVVGGVIALAALAFGLGMMKSWLSK